MKLQSYERDYRAGTLYTLKIADHAITIFRKVSATFLLYKDKGYRWHEPNILSV
jgi:hypothetical protein